MEICKFNQNGFCRFRDECRKRHAYEHDECNIKDCIKRQPKSCRNYSRKGKCRFKEGCAYLHVDKVKLTKEINEALAVIVEKHNTEMKGIKENISKLQSIIESMRDKKKSLENEERLNNVKKCIAAQNDSVYQTISAKDNVSSGISATDIIEKHPNQDKPNKSYKDQGKIQKK